MSSECTVKAIEEQHSCALRMRTDETNLYGAISQAMPRLMGYIGMRGLRTGGYPYVCFHNMDLQDWDIEIGIPLLSPLVPEGDFVAGYMPGCLAAATMHQGHMREMSQVYARLTEWMSELGFVAQGPVYEIYMNDPRELPPEQIYIGMMIPIKV